MKVYVGVHRRGAIGRQWGAYNAIRVPDSEPAIELRQWQAQDSLSKNVAEWSAAFTPLPPLRLASAARRVLTELARQ